MARTRCLITSYFLKAEDEADRRLREAGIETEPQPRHGDRDEDEVIRIAQGFDAVITSIDPFNARVLVALRIGAASIREWTARAPAISPHRANARNRRAMGKRDTLQDGLSQQCKVPTLIPKEMAEFSSILTTRSLMGIDPGDQARQPQDCRAWSARKGSTCSPRRSRTWGR